MSLRLLSEPGVNAKGSKSKEPVYFLNLQPGPTCFDCRDCLPVCLTTAGRHRLHRSARLRKTRLLQDDKFEFFKQLIHDLELVTKRMFNPNSKWHKMQPYVRLNGLSDIAWENINALSPGYEQDILGRTIPEMFPLLRFYDYTKNHNRIMFPNLPDNYRLVFSYSDSTAKHFSEIIQLTAVAVVFPGEPPETFRPPQSFKHWPVIDGDQDDIRFFDKPKTIIGLKAKGKAKTRENGLVR